MASARSYKSLAYEPWPTFDEQALTVDAIEIPVQVNGKVRSKIMVDPNADAESLESVALADAKISELLAGKSIVKKVIIPGRMVNLVIK